MSRYDAHTDQELLPLLIRGDKTAFNELYKRHFPSVFGFICSIIKDRPLSEDIAQEIFFGLWQRHEELVIHSTLKSYLIRAAKNRVINHMMADSVRKRYASEFTFMMRGYTNNTEERLAADELEKNIEKSISELPDRMQMVFRMSHYEHLPVKDIAQRLDISPRTVHHQLYLALQKLRVSLGEFIVLIWWLVC